MPTIADRRTAVIAVGGQAMLIRRHRTPAPELIDLEDAAALLDHFGISGRAFAAVALAAAPLLHGRRPDAALPQPLGREVRRLRLKRDNVVEAGGRTYHDVVVQWLETRAARLAAGVRGAYRLPRNPVWLDPATRQEIPLGGSFWFDPVTGLPRGERVVAQPGWWSQAEAAQPDAEAPDPSAEVAPTPAEVAPTPDALVARHRSFRALWREVRDLRKRGQANSPGYRRKVLAALHQAAYPRRD